jgi:hypothetical protein
MHSSAVIQFYTTGREKSEEMGTSSAGMAARRPGAQVTGRRRPGARDTERRRRWPGAGQDQEARLESGCVLEIFFISHVCDGIVRAREQEGDVIAGGDDCGCDANDGPSTG